MRKKEIRNQYLLKRKELSVEEVLKKSNLIFSRFLDEIDLDEVKYIHCFLPIIKNNEVNTNILIKELHKREIQVVVPVSNFETNQMDAALYSSDTYLILKRGISEPEKPLFVNPKLIDLVILPLAIFDKSGFRIGYGGGFYDRFLQKLKRRPKLIGVSFFDAIESIYPTEFDIPLDYCLTPSKTYFFT